MKTVKTAIVFCLAIVGCDNKPAIPTVDGKTESEWVALAKTGDEDKQVDASRKLSQFHNEQSRNELMELMKDDKVGVRYYAAESFWDAFHDPLAVPILGSVIRSHDGWAYRDRLTPLLKRMGPTARQLVPAIQEAIDNSPNSKIAKWQECLNAAQGL